MVPIFIFTQPSISYKLLGSPCTLIYGRFCCFLRLHLNACNSFKNGWILDFENAAVRYNVGILYHAKKTILRYLLVCWKSVFVQYSLKILHVFVFKPLEHFSVGGCRQVSWHPMKIHVFEVLFCFMVYRRQPATIWSNLHLKKCEFRQILVKF